MELTVSTIYSKDEALVMRDLINRNFYTHNTGERDNANGVLEAWFMGELRHASKETLGDKLTSLKEDFGTMNAFKRAVERTKAYRGKNPVWKTFTLE